MTKDEVRGSIYAKYRSQAEFSKTLGFERTEVNDFLSGKRNPGVRKIIRMSRLLGIGIENLISAFYPDEYYGGETHDVR